MGKELPAMNNYTWHILFRVLTTTAQPGQDTVFKYSQKRAQSVTFVTEWMFHWEEKVYFLMKIFRLWNATVISRASSNIRLYLIFYWNQFEKKDFEKKL